MPAQPGDAFRRSHDDSRHDLPPNMTVADVKAELADAGLSLEPSARITSFDRPKNNSEVNLLVLDRVSNPGQPPYCVHGYCRCISCEEICYLGSETLQAMLDRSRNIFAICHPCARQAIPDGQHRTTGLEDH
jgi:hypothetical protein